MTFQPKVKKQPKPKEGDTEEEVPDYPEHEKLKAIGNGNIQIGEFLDWMQDNGYVISERVQPGDPRHRGGGRNALLVETDWSDTRKTNIIGEFFGIDPVTLQAEKEAMLGRIRDQNHAREVLERKQSRSKVTAAAKALRDD